MRSQNNACAQRENMKVYVEISLTLMIIEDIHYINAKVNFVFKDPSCPRKEVKIQ